MALELEIVAFEKMLPALKRDADGKFVLFFGHDFVASYGSFEEAAEDAVRRYGRGPYLIRQVGAPDMILPASVAYNFHAAN